MLYGFERKEFLKRQVRQFREWKRAMEEARRNRPPSSLREVDPITPEEWAEAERAVDAEEMAKKT